MIRKKDKCDPRPDLTEQISSEDFLSFYWLKTELVRFSRQQGLSTGGGKRELQKRIASFLQSRQIEISPSKKSFSKIAHNSKIFQLALECIIPSHFRCTREARVFFVSHAGPRFRYTVQLQKYFKTHPGVTFAELIEVWRKQQLEQRFGKKSEIEPQFEYNQFTRDYFSDPNNKGKTCANCVQAWNEFKKKRRSRKYSNI